jgi:hypothetical protein
MPENVPHCDCGKGCGGATCMCGAGSGRPLYDNSGNTAMMLAGFSLHADATVHFEHFHTQTEFNQTLHNGAPDQIPKWQH